MDDFISRYGFLSVQLVLQAVLALSLYLPLMAGQLSLASPAFYAVGGYVAAVLSTQKFLPAAGTTYPEPLQSFVTWLATVFPRVASGEYYPVSHVLLEMVIAGVVCGIFALIVGLPALRLRGIYLALGTIAFVQIVQVLALNLPITGGAIGIFNVPQSFHTRFEYLWIAAPLLLLSMWFVGRLERTRVGRAFIALREDELAAAAMGINPTYHKVLAFTLGAILAGMVGALSAHALNTWNARQGTFDVGVLYLAYVIIGGSRTFIGPVLGAALLTALPEALNRLGGISGMPSWLSQFLNVEGGLIIYGVLIAIAAIFFPQGLVTPERLSRRRAARLQQTSAADESTAGVG